MAHAGGCTDYWLLGDCDPGVLAVIASSAGRWTQRGSWIERSR
jgi:hypothetical protein